MRTMLRRLLPILIVMSVLAASAPASAVPPFKETFVDQGIFTLPDINCGTFMLTEAMTSEKVQTTTFFDEKGVPVKVATHANFFGVITNSDTLEQHRDHAAFTETLDLPKGTTTVSGASYHYVESGKGQVYAEVGHKISVSASGEVTFQAGQDDFTQTDLQGLCDALG